jgi:hypothetical protein
MKKITNILFSTIILLIISCNSATKKEEPKNASSNNTSNTATSNATQTDTNNVNTTKPSDKAVANINKNYIVDYKAVGNIKLDMTKAEVLKLFPNATESTILNEVEIPCLDVKDTDGSLLYKVGIDDGKKVSVIITSNKNMKTVSGIKVGSTLAEAKKIYPDIKVSLVEGEWVAFAEKRFLSFTLTGNTNDSKVTEIWVS